MIRTTAVLVFYVSLVSATPLYTVVDLGTLGGNESVAYAINGSGEAVGWSSIGVDSQAVSFGPLASLCASGNATAINSAGSIAGTAYRDGTSHGMVWTSAGSLDFGPGTNAAAVNDAGQVAGNAEHAFLYTAGTRTDLGVLSGGSWSVAEAINEAGAVAGYGDTPGGIDAFLWTPGQGMTQLGGAGTHAMGLNNEGAVVGSGDAGGGYAHAFLWSSGTSAIDLGTLGGAQSYAYAINDGGSAVGYSWLAGDEQTHAWVLLNGVMADLNTAIAGGTGWELTAAYGINSNGQIVGSGIFGAQNHAFRLDPVGQESAAVEIAAAEPGGWELFLTGAILLGVRWFTGNSREDV